MMSLFLIGQAQCVFHKVFNAENGNDSSIGIIVDDAGDIITCGRAGIALYVIKTTGCGDTIWTRQFDFSISADFGFNLIQNSDTSYVIAGVTYNATEVGNDGYLFSLSVNGDSLWYQQPNLGVSDRFMDLKLTSDGGFIVAGHRNVTEDSTIFLLKTDALGNEEWRNYYGSIDSENVENVDIALDGGYYISGDRINSSDATNDFQLIKTDSSGNEDWRFAYNSLAGIFEGGGQGVATADGGFIMVGGKEKTSGGDTESWIVKVNSNGSLGWSKEWDLSIPVYFLSDVKQCEDGSYIAVGNTSYSTGFPLAWLVKFDDVGDTLWTKEYTYYGQDVSHTYPYRLTKAPDNGYVLSGYVINSSLSVGNDAWILKVDSMGNICSIVDTTQGCSQLDCNYITANFTISDTITLSNDTAWLNLQGNEFANTYLWSVDGQNSTLQNPSFGITTTGTYAVSCTVSYDGQCEQTYTANVVVDTATGIEYLKMKSSTITISPNPTNGNVTINTTGGDELVIYNALGTLMQSTSVSFFSTISFNALADFGQGMYFVALKDQGQVVKVKRMVVTN